MRNDNEQQVRMGTQPRRTVMRYYVMIGKELFEFTDADTATRFAEIAKAKALNKTLKIGMVIEVD